jgi:WD40 repeat protein/transcriptional regulator with XRE-family HTH domain
VPWDDQPVQRFSDSVLQIRGRLDLTQRELAARLGLHTHSIQGWEAGTSFPNAQSLQGLIAAILRAGGFTSGREEDEAAALWTAAMREAPRLKAAFDHAWFRALLDSVVGPSGDPRASGATARPAHHGRADGARRHSWGDAPDVAGFVGRETERRLLGEWASDERCRVVAVLGLGGVGKTLLTARLAQDVIATFERVYWRSLRDAPTPREWLTGAIGFLAPDEAGRSESEAEHLRHLIELLGQARCLLVLDNFETVLDPSDRAGDYAPGYEGYGALLRHVAEAPHVSCLVLTSREEPSVLRPLRGAAGPVRTVTLTGLDTDDGRALLLDKGLEGDEAAWQTLVQRYGGNSLALKLVGETIRELFGGSIAEYLEYAASTPGEMISGVHQLLETQIRRLSDSEQRLLRWLAVEREPVELVTIATELRGHLDRGTLLDAVEAMRRRSLLEHVERGPSLSLSSAILEFVTGQLIDDVAQEIVATRPALLIDQPLLKATGKEYVRGSQERLIVAPLLMQLVESLGSDEATERCLTAMLDQLRGRPPADQGYGPGNIVNVLRMLRGSLRRTDLSSLAIRQADLQDVEVQDGSLAGAHLAESIIAEAFSYPTAVALSADGAYLAAGTATGDVCLWRVADRTLLATLEGRAGGAHCVALSADGHLVVSGSFDGTVRLWERERGRSLATLQGHRGAVWGVALSADGALAASGGFDGDIRLWEAASGRLRSTLRGHNGGIWSVALSADGRLAASGGYDGTVRLWDAATGRALASLPGHSGGVRGVALSGDGQLVASGGFDGTVRVWDGRGGSLTTLQGHSGGVRAVTLSADGRLIASGGFDGTVRVWETESGEPLATMQAHSGGVRGVALSGHGRLMASGGFDGAVRLWDLGAGRLLTTLRGQTNGVWSVALSDDGGQLVGGGFDGTVRIWDAELGRLQSTLLGHTGSAWGVALSDDRRVLASVSLDGTLRLWDTATARARVTIEGHPGGPYGLSLSRDGQLVAGGSPDGTVSLWDAQTGRLRLTVPGHPGGIWGVALDGDGRLLASGGVDGAVRLWETETGRLRTELHGHDGGAYSVALSRDGRLVVSGSYGGTVRLWDAEQGRPQATMHGHPGGAVAVALSGDGRVAASGGEDWTVRLWDTASGQLALALRGHTGGIWGVALTADGRLAASSSIDGTIRLWDTSTGACPRVVRGDRRYERLDSTGVTGITEAQRGALRALGATERVAREATPNPR